MATVLSFLSFFGILIGLVSLAYPLRFMYIHDRRTAAIVLAVSVVTFLPAAVIDGTQQQQARARQEQAASVPPPVATPPKSPAERAEEECNKLSGAAPDCKEVLTRLMVEEMAHPKAPAPVAAVAPRRGSCKSDWRQCSDNADLVNNFEDITRGSVLCQYAAKELAKYGSPSFPFLSFYNFRSGSDYVRTGLATLVEPKAEFQNAYGTMVHSVITCKYDLNSRQVVDVSVN
jgi:hypothetical protein